MTYQAVPYTFRQQAGPIPLRQLDADLAYASGKLVSVKDSTFGAKGDGVTNDYAAIQAALTYVGTYGGWIYIPAGLYLIGTSTLVIPANVTVLGEGADYGLALGSVIKYTGVSDAVQSNATINTSTPKNITIQDIGILCTVRTAKKACYADTGGSFINLIRVACKGNDFGVILDQSEVVTIQQCKFQMTGAGTTGGIWIVNGDDRTTSADEFFTNRITIAQNQFFGNGVGLYGVVDDGGICHSFENNNFDHPATAHIRMTASWNPVIVGNEIEGAVAAIQFKDAALSGNASSFPQTICPFVGSNFMLTSTTAPLVTFESVTSVNFYTADNNQFDSQDAAGHAYASGVITLTGGYAGVGNTQSGTATDKFAGNTTPTSGAYTPTWTGSVGNPAIGDGALQGTWFRTPGQMTINVSVAAGSTTSFGSGFYTFGLPSGITATGLSGNGAWLAIIGGTTYCGTARDGVPPGTGIVLYRDNNNAVGSTLGSWASGDTITMTLSISVTP